MKLIVVIALILAPRLAQATSCPTGYTCKYFSASGNDSTGYGTQASPWQTVAKAMTITNKKVSVPTAALFKQGDTWMAQQYNISGAVGAALNPIIIGTYGTGPRPVFDENNTQNFCFAAHATVAKYVTLGYGVGFECKHARYGGVNFYATYMMETSSSPAFPGIIVENMYIHDTGNGCSRTDGPCIGSDRIGCSGYSCTYEYDNQLAFNQESSCNNTSSGCAGDSVHFINNIVRYVGGHNCVEVHGDYGQAVVSGNIIGPGCSHEAIDIKQSGWSNANTPGSRTALVYNNIVDTGVSTGYYSPGQASFIALAGYDQNTSIEYYNNIAYDTQIGFEVCAENQISANGSAGIACKAGPYCNAHAFIYNNTVYADAYAGMGVLGPWCNAASALLSSGMNSTQTTMTINNGEGFVPSSGFGAPFIVKVDHEQILVGGASSATSWNNLARGYNGTSPANHTSSATVIGGAYGTGYIDARNNIWDGSNFNELADGEPTKILAEDYNDCGGAQGAPTSKPSNGVWLCAGSHDLHNVNPQYVSASLNAPDSSSAPNFTVQSSLLVGKGQPGLVSGNNSIGAVQ